MVEGLEAPSYLRRLFFAALALVLVGLAGGWISWLGNMETPERWQPPAPLPSRPWACEGQLKDRWSRLAESKRQLAVSWERTEELEQVAVDFAAPAFLNARVELDREEAFRSSARKKEMGLDFDVGAEVPASGVLLYLGLLGLLWLVARDVMRSPSGAFSGDPLSRRLGWPIAIATLVVFAPALLAEILVSVLNQKKSWFGWDSFCVSPGSFAFTKVALLGVDLGAGVVLAIFWALLDPAHRPPIRIDDATARRRMALYVDFLRKWSFWGVVVVAMVLIGWLQLATSAVNPSGFERSYVFAVIGGILAPGYLLSRIVGNVHGLQREYAEQVVGRDPTQVPPDPTARLYGDGGWKLPAAAAAVLSGALYVLDKLGIFAIIAGR